MSAYKNIIDFIECLQGRQIKLKSDGIKLQSVKPKGVNFTTDEKHYIKQNRAPLIDYLKNSTAQKGWQGIESIYALSPLQEGILFHAIHSPQSNQYCVQLNWSLRGDLNIAAFEKSWSDLIQAHAIFRTSFKWQGLDQPVQVVHKKAQLRFTFSNVQNKPQIKDVVAQIKNEDKAKTIDLSKPCAMRLHVVQTADDLFEVIWNHHHILTDGWCTPRIIGEVTQRYMCLTENLPFKEENIPTYESYIRYLRQQDNDSLSLFWQEHLEGIKGANALCIAKETDWHKDISHAVHNLQLSVEFTARCTAFAQVQQVTVNVLVQLAWAKVLAVYSGSDDVVMGTIVSGRPSELEGVEEILGLFINSLPLRFNIKKDESISDASQRLQNSLREINDHSGFSLSSIQQACKLEGNGSLFDSLFVFENYPVEESLKNKTFSNLQLLAVEYQDKTNFPLVLTITCKDSLNIEFTYDCDQYDGAAIAQLANNFKNVLEAFVNGENEKLATVFLLDQVEYKNQLQLSKGEVIGQEGQHTVHSLFARQVLSTPQNIAVKTAAGETLTYQQIDEKSSALAFALQEKLGRPLNSKDVIGLYLEKDLALIYSILAVLKAGGSFLNLDPTYPQERLQYMLEDSACAVTIFSAPKAVQSLNLDTVLFIEDVNWQETAYRPVESPVKDAAYHVYTSGTTGKPKAVAIPHQGIVNAFYGWQSVFELNSNDCHLQMAA
ncbi:MAG: AMP-binding protein, partial [Lentisphaeraceae bacterium]|nr:AMP-binding protein [Lentisphaeraceae bacterium]